MIWKILSILFLFPIVFILIVVIRYLRSNVRRNNSYTCSYCGEEVESNAQYCPQCGSQFSGIKRYGNNIEKQAVDPG